MTNTPRLNLNEPVSSQNTDVQTALDNQLLTIDDTMDVLVCTSITHPTDILFDGRLIYETDTGNLMYYDLPTTSWKLYSNGRGPLGRLAFVSSTAAGTAVSGTQEAGPYLSLSFNSQKNRLYAVHWALSTDHQTGHNTPSRWVVVRGAFGASVSQTDSVIQQMIADVDDNSTGLSVPQVGSDTFFPNQNSLYTVGVFNRSTAGTDQTLINANSFHTLSVEDLGYYTG